MPTLKPSSCAWRRRLAAKLRMPRVRPQSLVQRVAHGKEQAEPFTVEQRVDCGVVTDEQIYSAIAAWKDMIAE